MYNNVYYTQVLERVRQSPFLVTLHYAFQTDAKLHLILGEISSRSMNLLIYYSEFQGPVWGFLGTAKFVYI